jgi:N-acetylglucosamine-6-sulfatase
MRARLIVVAVLIVLAVALVDQALVKVDAPPARAGGSRQSPPNIVMLMTDDQTVEDLAVMPRTRELIGDDGVTFARNYASYPVCAPSRATFLSGQYAHDNGVMGLVPPTGGYARFDSANDLPVWLQRAGYVTSHIGKYINGYGTQVRASVPPGWTEWHGAIDPSTYRMWGYTLDENGTPHTYGRPFVQDPRLYQTDVYREKAVDFIRRRAPSQRPFFLSVAFLAPHHEQRAIRRATGQLVRPAPRDIGALATRPFETSRSFDEPNLTDKPGFMRHGTLSLGVMGRIVEHYRQRQRSLLAVDDAVEAIVDELRQTGELDDTYIFLTSDNGYIQGEHDVPSGKELPYDPSTQVPLLLRGPGIPEGRTSREIVGNVDLAPTILQMAGARPGLPQDGRSLLPFAWNPRLRSNRPFLHETGGIEYIPPRDRHGGPAVMPVRAYRAVRTSRWLYIEYRDGARELYDLTRDPNELHSHAGDPRYAATRRALHRVLERLAACRGASCRRPAGPIPAPLAAARDARAS